MEYESAGHPLDRHGPAGVAMTSSRGGAADAAIRSEDKHSHIPDQFAQLDAVRTRLVRATQAQVARTRKEQEVDSLVPAGRMVWRRLYITGAGH
jgi:hypothetical protein